MKKWEYAIVEYDYDDETVTVKRLNNISLVNSVDIGRDLWSDMEDSMQFQPKLPLMFFLNKIGKAGWELCETLPFKLTFCTSKIDVEIPPPRIITVLLFKRPLD